MSASFWSELFVQIVISFSQNMSTTWKLPAHIGVGQPCPTK